MIRRKRGGFAEFYPYHTAREFNVAKRDAMLAMRHALDSGRIVRQDCAVCGLSRAEGHHDDYAKPLEVIWLCRHHHRLRDAEIRETRRASFRDLPMSYLTRQARLQTVPYASVKKQSRRRSLVTNEKAIALVVDTTRAISALMDAADLSETALARKLGRSSQAVNQTFAGGFRSLKLIAAFADAMGYDVCVEFHKRQERVAS